MLLENAPVLCNTVSKNVYQVILFLWFIQVVIYTFRIGSLKVFSLKIRHMHTISMLINQFSRWINRHSSILLHVSIKSKKWSFPLCQSQEMLEGNGNNILFHMSLKLWDTWKAGTTPSTAISEEKCTTKYVSQHERWGWTSKNDMFGNLYNFAYSFDLLLY